MGSHGVELPDYVPHHNPFQYFAQTANPHHLPPASVAAIGTATDPANHQYDLDDFWAAAAAKHLPAVSFLKAPAWQNGHAGYSDPLAEQRYLVETINRLQKLPEWREMAIVIAYDDSDGWYDHMMPPIVRGSISAADALDAQNVCGTGRVPRQVGRCGLGPRMPLLVISPWARANHVEHSVTEQASILRFIEDNWDLGRLGGDSADADAGPLDPMFDFTRKQPLMALTLDPATGQPVAGQR
jgi:phospholipase C